MSEWRPMSHFDPDKRGQLVHDQPNDRVMEWEPERYGEDWQGTDDISTTTSRGRL